MTKYVRDCQLSLYANDTALYTSCTSNVEIVLNLYIELILVTEWLMANKLTTNVPKTKYIVFGTRHLLQTMPDLNLNIGGQKIERVDSIKYLGVLLDDRLTFEDHIQYVIGKSTEKLGMLRRFREFLDRKTSILLYKILVLPHIDYCDLVYMTATEYNLHQLQLIQNVAYRIVLQADNRTNIKAMHTELKLLDLKDRQFLHLSMECFRQVNSDSSLNYMFDHNVNEQRVTPGALNNNMKVPIGRTDMGCKAFSYKAHDTGIYFQMRPKL